MKTIGKFREALDADLYCFVDSKQYETEDSAMDNAKVIPSVRLPMLRQMCYVSAARRHPVEKAFKEASIVSVHSFYRYHCQWVHWAFKKFGTPYWHVPHGILDPYVLSYGQLAKRMYLHAGGRDFLDSASCTIFATQREQEKAESVFGPMRGEVIHWPVDLVDLSGREERRRKTRRELGIPEDATVLLYFGRVQGMKRPLETIEAVAGVKSDALHLLMVGPLERISEADLRNQAEAQGLHHFHFVGSVYGSQKYDYLFAADAYVSFSIRENFNHTAAESMSAAVPVILSQGNDLGPIVEESGAGWYLKEDSVAALRSAIEGLMGTVADDLKKMGDSGRSLVANVFSFEHFRNRLLNLAKRYGRA